MPIPYIFGRPTVDNHFVFEYVCGNILYIYDRIIDLVNNHTPCNTYTTRRSIMKKAFVGFLCFIIILFSIFSALAEASSEDTFSGMRQILLIISLDKTLPKTGKTYGMGNYIMTLDGSNRVLKFTSFPYNLAVDIPAQKVAVKKQLQFVCKELGPEGEAEVIESNFGITIDHWLLINMTGLADLVDLVGGIEVNLADLSINKKASDIKYMVDKPWKNVAEPGLQILSGIQAMAYMSDTYYDQPTISQEEVRFRERQELLIREILAGLRNFQLDTESLLALIFSGFAKNYTTDIPLGGVLTTARADLSGCLQSDPVFLHIPQEIFTVEVADGWESLGYTEEDAAAVRAFVEN
jgi:anionic cell wall polymer biosynthesis LytR-Cps2A-Psr (LCP) family protein